MTNWRNRGYGKKSSCWPSGLFWSLKLAHEANRAITSNSWSMGKRNYDMVQSFFYVDLPTGTSIGIAEKLDRLSKDWELKSTVDDATDRCGSIDPRLPYQLSRDKTKTIPPVLILLSAEVTWDYIWWSIRLFIQKYLGSASSFYSVTFKAASRVENSHHGRLGMTRRETEWVDNSSENRLKRCVDSTLSLCLFKRL